jgi:hypothetical protein
MEVSQLYTLVILHSVSQGQGLVTQLLQVLHMTDTGNF